MIICPSCGTENQDHFRFCQGCGTDVSQAPRGTAGKDPAKTDAKIDAVLEPVGTPMVPAVVEEPPAPAAPEPVFVASAPAVPAAEATSPPASGRVTCNACGHVNEPGNVFCGACGARVPAKVAAEPEPVRPPSSPPPNNFGRTSLGVMSPFNAPKVVRFTLTLLRVDGTDAGVFSSMDDHAVVGREVGGIFGSDASLSPIHARFERRGDRLFVSDASSLNGVYRRLVRNVPAGLENGDGFRIGQEVLRYEALPQGDAGSDVQTIGSPRHGVRARIVSIIGRGEYGNASSIPANGLLLGRERGDVLFPEDGYVSGLHCRIHHEGGQAFITDLGSSNGTFVRLRTETELGANDVLLMGQQLFRVGLP